jgi:hypothetical protein
MVDMRRLGSTAIGFLLAAAVVMPAVPQDAKPPAADEWHKMFDGKSLDGWKDTPFIAKGKVTIQDGMIVIGSGAMTGVNYTKPFPKYNYEVRLEAARLDGYDFFAGITFPVGDTFCSWINGGWGGSLVGLSSLDDMDASENETGISKPFARGQWYKFRLRVAEGYIQAWIDDELVIQVALAGRNVGLRAGSQIDLSVPFGISTYSTVSGVRNIEYRELPAEAR